MSRDFVPDWTMPLSEYKRIQEQSMPQIKPLVWVDYSRTPVRANTESRTPFGRFMLTVVHDGAYVSHCPFHVHSIPEFKSEVEAKAWCQSEYERRVRECLEL